jgi:hypothetical protein
VPCPPWHAPPSRPPPESHVRHPALNAALVPLCVHNCSVQEEDDEYELDIDALDPDTCWKLQAFVDAVLAEQAAKQPGQAPPPAPTPAAGAAAPTAPSAGGGAAAGAAAPPPAAAGAAGDAADGPAAPTGSGERWQGFRFWHRGCVLHSATPLHLPDVLALILFCRPPVAAQARTPMKAWARRVAPAPRLPTRGRRSKVIRPCCRLRGPRRLLPLPTRRRASPPPLKRRRASPLPLKRRRASPRSLKRRRASLRPPKRRRLPPPMVRALQRLEPLGCWPLPACSPFRSRSARSVSFSGNVPAAPLVPM